MQDVQPTFYYCTTHFVPEFNLRSFTDGGIQKPCGIKFGGRHGKALSPGVPATSITLTRLVTRTPGSHVENGEAALETLSGIESSASPIPMKG